MAESRQDARNKITLRVNEENPEPVELIAQSIIDVADAFKKIDSGKLKRKTIVILIQDITKLPQRDIEAVLNAAAQLKERYLKDIKK